ATIDSVETPEGFEPVESVPVEIEGGALTLAELIQPRQGTLRLIVSEQTVENGRIVHIPMENAGVRLTREGTVPEGLENLTSNAKGIIEIALPAGTYEAALDGTDDSVTVTVANDTETEAELLTLAAEGGVELTITARDDVDAMLLTQMQFELRGTDSTFPLRLEEGVFRAEHLPAGQYTLSETQAPAGYTLMEDRALEVAGGQLTSITVPMVEYATVRVAKYGLTFDDQMKNYLVPLKGRYGVFVREGEELVPYPDEDHQVLVYAHVASDSVLPSVARLPAAEEGSVFYLMELDASAGFEKDGDMHEITVHPGDTVEVTGSVSSDRGFYHLTLVDAQSGEPVSGALFTLADAEGNVLDTFELNGTYRNEMAIPVGDYVLTEIRAASGYLLTDARKEFRVEPYLSMGGQVTEVAFETLQIPGADWGSGMFYALSASGEQGLTMLTVDPAGLPSMIGLTLPQMTLTLNGESGESTGIRMISLTGAENGTQNADIRVEYAAAGSGWLMSRSQVVRAAELPENVIFPEEEAVYAVRLTYLDPETGLEQCGPGFVPGDVILQIENYREQPVSVELTASFTGRLIYQTEEEQPSKELRIHSEAGTAFEAVPSGISAPVVMGRDGRISGVVFYDRNADGLLTPDEKGIPDITVTLCDVAGNEIEETQTDGEGRYAFTSLSAGQYTLNFDRRRLYTHGLLYSDYLCSRISMTGISEPVTIDATHTDEWLLAGAVSPAAVKGALVLQVSRDQVEPVEGWAVELLHAGEEEPVTVWTTDSGTFSSDRLLPGEYELRIQLPENTLSAEAEDGRYIEVISVSEGETLTIPTITFKRSAAVQGSVRVDEDGDGTLPDQAEALRDVRVEISAVQADGHAEPVGSTVTDAEGRYRFDGLLEGDYVISFQLDDPWVFTRYGTDSDVFGSVSGSGSTQAFRVDCGSETVRNAGVTLPTQFTVTVFNDTRMDGIRGTDEPGVPGVRISLVRIEGEMDGETESLYTDENGSAVFERVSPGRYAVLYQMPGIWRTTVMPQTGDGRVGSFVPQSTEPEGRSGTFEIPMGTALELSIGAVQTGEISGRAYYDDNADAAMSGDEPGAEGVTVSLLDADGIFLQETTTGPDGSYAFTGLPQGRYYVSFMARDGECFSGNERTASRGAAERSDESVTRTRAIQLESGRTLSGADAGIVRPSRIVGSLFVDRNANRVRDEEEYPLSFASVSLTNASGRAIVSTVETDEEGNFVFERVYPGRYKLRIEAGSGYVYSGNIEGNPLPVESQSGNWVYTAEFVIYGNTAVENLSYGFLSQGVISGIVWEDSAYTGVYPGGNGLRYVTVTLYDGDGTVCGSVKTDREGKFRFEKLMPGEYSLEVALEAGSVVTPDGEDSMAPRANAETCTIPLGTLAMGEVRDDLRIGALKPGSVTGYAWYDSDNDGRRQTDSTPMANVPVTLQVLSGSDSGSVRETTTDENGRYRFDAVMPGTFILSATVPEEMAFTRNRSGQKRVSIISQTDDFMGESDVLTMEAGLNLQDVDIGAVGIGQIEGQAWTDAVYDGIMNSGDVPLAGVTVTLLDAATGETVRRVQTDADGRYSLERLRTGDYRIRVDLPDAMIFTLNGSGIIPMTDSSRGETESFHLDMGGILSGYDIGAIVPAVMEGAVTDEESGNGCMGVIVSLMEGGTALKTVQTDARGMYRFDMIRPGSYRLRFGIEEKQLFALTVPLTLTDADAREGETETVQLPMGEHVAVTPIQTVRCAEVGGFTWLDANVDGHMDTGEKALPGVRLTLLEEETERVVAQTESDENGVYALPNLRRGRYILEAELPEEMLFTDYTGVEADSCMEPTDNNLSRSRAFDLSSGETVRMNIGGILPGTIGDTVWIDLDGNGLQDYMEPQQPGVEITLLQVGEDGSETEVTSVISDMYG
ncbi:MAG: carboxypeptidase regulatory-like domain-containing protein, partial [Clostridia bacterium]|nr:carboxypeptidase regulatory-like domain-containing protein [Clostridia bacterium]